MHSLIIGQTESGKSTLAKVFASKLTNSGKKVAVLDPLFDPDWKCNYRTDDINEMTQYLKVNRSVYVFVDESGAYFNDGNDTTYSWLATRSRHYGHSVFFIAQRAIQIPKTMRDQCSRLYLFTSSRSDGKIHSEEWNKDVLETCNTLPKLKFFQCDRYNLCEVLTIKDYKEIVREPRNRNNDSSDPDGSGRSSNTNRKMGGRPGKGGQ